jgi:hypothetical protein
MDTLASPNLPSVPATMPKADVPHHCNSRPSAAFIAQLAATAMGAPQTRPRRRSEPAEAAAMYAAAARGGQPYRIERKL